MLYVRVCEVDMMHRCNEMRLLKKRINIMKVAKLHSTRFIIKKIEGGKWVVVSTFIHYDGI